MALTVKMVVENKHTQEEKERRASECMQIFINVASRYYSDKINNAKRGKS